MEIHLHECDPDGDIILQLRNPDTPFAVWDDTAEHAVARHNLRPIYDESMPSDDVFASEPTPIDYGLAPTVDQPAPTPIEPVSADELVSFENAPEPADKSASSDDSNSEEDGRAEPLGVEMRVSSRHLILASPYFKRMLNGDWKESNILQSQGCLRIEETDWDAGALQILMDIIHGRTRKVPKVISLEMLAKIAVLVDYYECLEVVEIFSSIWIEHLKSTAPKRYSRDVMLWVCISWVFQQSDMFQEATKVAMKYSTGPVQTMRLPIPDRIIRIIDQRRQDYIEHIVAALHSLVSDLCKSGSSCTFACSSMRLGALIKQMNDRNLYSPRPEAPFLGFSVALVTESIRAIRTPYWCSRSRRNIYHSTCKQHECSLGHHIDAIIGTLDALIDAPMLEQFLL